MEYILVSVKHTAPGDDNITFWRPGDSGYTRDVHEAGKYNNVPQDCDYHNNTTSTVAVPAKFIHTLMEKADNGTDIPPSLVVRNTDDNWAYLLCHRLFRSDGNNVPDSVGLPGYVKKLENENKRLRSRILELQIRLEEDGILE